jgi:hypothetical protein
MGIAKFPVGDKTVYQAQSATMRHAGGSRQIGILLYEFRANTLHLRIANEMGNSSRATLRVSHL